MHDVVLGLGSNLGDREAMLRGAEDAIDNLHGTEVVAVSPLYETPPMGPQDQGSYLNAAAHIRTQLEPLELVECLQQIEAALGRAEPGCRKHWGPREIDIDVLLYADRVIDDPNLSVPHAGMHERWFVLKPLVDIAPNVLHPLSGQTASQLLEQVQASEAIS
jgi:2-amino-4-hydroxy-6-hydroxymethyldihydropteridine diphosphokinase